MIFLRSNKNIEKKGWSINVGVGGEMMVRKYSSSGFKTWWKKHVENIGTKHGCLSVWQASAGIGLRTFTLCVDKM